MLFFQEQIPVKFLAAFELPREEEWLYNNQRNSYYSLSIRIRGKAEFHIDDRSFTVEPGEILLIPPDQIYSQHTDGEVIHSIHFDALEYFKAETLEKQTVQDWDTVCRLFRESSQLYLEKPVGWYYQVTSLLYQLINLLHKETGIRESKTADSIDLGASYLEKHYSDHSLTVAQIAQISGYSEAYFRRLFLERFGVTPSERIDYLRLERAKRLLEARDHTMAEIAEHVGIAEPKYFSTWFRKHTGISPRNYVNMLRG